MNTDLILEIAAGVVLGKVALIALEFMLAAILEG